MFGNLNLQGHVSGCISKDIRKNKIFEYGFPHSKALVHVTIFPSKRVIECFKKILCSEIFCLVRFTNSKQMLLDSSYFVQFRMKR